MEITLFELNVLIDAALGSASIADTNTARMMFRWDRTQRMEIVNEILQRMHKVKVTAKDGSASDEPTGQAVAR